MESNIKEITINGVDYVEKGTAPTFAKNTKGLPYVIVRATSAGVFAGFLKEKLDGEVTLLESRRLWYWTGAASLSQLAIDGSSSPSTCKFPEAVAEQTIKGWIEIIPTTEKAKKCIDGVKVWRA